MKKMRRRLLFALAALLATLASASVTAGAMPDPGTDKPRVDLYLYDGRSAKMQPCVREAGDDGLVQYWCRDIVNDTEAFPDSEVQAFQYARYGDLKNAPSKYRDINGNNYTVYARGAVWEACHHGDFDALWICHTRAEDAKVYLYQTDEWDYYLGGMRSWAGDSAKVINCLTSIYSAHKAGPNGSEWEACTGR